MTAAERDHAEALRLIDAAQGSGQLALVGLNGLEAIPDEITKLQPWLTYLRISRCNSLIDIRAVKGLPGLKQLSIHGCSAIGNLKAFSDIHELSLISIINCDSISNIKPLEGLIKLNSLIISSCPKIVDLHPLVNLVNLEHLYIGGLPQLNSINPIAHLYKLNAISIIDCKSVTNIEALVELHLLGQLTLSLTNNNVYFPMALVRPGIKLLIGGSTFANLSDELVDESYFDLGPLLLAHKSELDHFGGAELREVKLFLLGNGRAGKSSLVRALRGEPHSREEKSTHGIRHWHWPVPVMLKGDEGRGPQPVDVNIWDFGGQQIYHELHRLFMGTRAVFILLWNPWEEQWKMDPDNPDHPAEFKEDEYHPLDYWLDQIHAYSRLRKPQIILVRNFMDKDKEYEEKHKRRAPNSWKDAVSERYRDAANIQYVEFSAADRDSALGRKRMGELRLALEYALNEQMRQLMSRYIPKGRHELRQYLAGLVKDGPAGEGDHNSVRTMPYAEFDALVAHYCTVNGTHDTSKVLRFLHDIGALYYNERMPEKVVLDQRWLVDAIYAMLKEPHTRAALRDQEGLFTMSDLMAWGWHRYSPEERELFRDFMLSCGVAIEFISAERSASKETVLLAPAFLPSVKSPSVQRLLAAQPVTSRREQAWTEHQWLGRDVALHTVAKAAEAFGNQGDYWRHGFLLRGHHDVQVSMRWEASTAGSFGGRIVLYATGAAGAGKTTLVKEVVHVLESGHSFPRDAKWTWEDLRDADAGSATPRSEPPDKGGGGDHQHTPIPEATALDAGFSKATRPTLQEHSPVWVGFSYKGKAGDDPAKELSKGERATRALRQALEASAAKLNFLLIDYQRPQEHPFQNTGRLIEALSRYSSISIAFMEKEYWGSANCLAEAAMLYEADPAGIFDKNKQQIVRLDDTRCICDPKSDDYQERLDAIVGEAQKWYAREHDAREKRRTGAGTEHVAAHPQWPWIKIALNHEQLDKFNCALNRADATSTLPATSDEATVNEWAKKHAAWVVGLLTGK